MAVNFPWIYPVRAIQVLFAIIVLGLIAYVIDAATGGWSSTVNFMMFNAVWTAFVAVPYLVFGPMFIPNFPHKFVILGVELVTMLFWFAGFIALAALLGPPKYCNSGPCHAGQAATAFGAFEWVLFLVTAVYAVMGVVRNRSSEPPTAVP